MSMAVKAAKYGGGQMGDPGLFGDIWKGIKSVGRAVGGVAKASGLPIISGVGGAVAGILSKRHSTPGASTINMPALPPISTFKPQSPTPGVGRQGPGVINRFKMAGQTLIPGGVEPFANGKVPYVSSGGYHLNRTGYFVKERDERGNFTGGWERVEPGTKWVKNRRMNPMNPGAASRGIRRIKAGKRMAKKFNAISIRKDC